MAQETSEIFYDFDLIIRSKSMGLYTVSLLNETGKKVAEEVFQHFASLRDLPKALQKAKTTDPNEVPSMYDKLQGFGEKAHKALLSGKIGREVRRLSEVGGSIALRLRIGSPDLVSVPWETIYDGTEFLAASPGFTLSRIPPGTAKSDKPVLETTPNFACILMRPFLEEYGDESRWESRKKALQASLAGVRESGRLNMEVFEVTTLKDIRDILGGDKFEIVHIFSISEDRQVLLAEGELISAAALTAELSGLKNLRLVVLSSAWEHNIALEEMGRNLLAAKIPGILVMPLAMGQAQEKAFLSSFYQAVGAGKRLDYAISLARRAAMEAGETRSDFLLPKFFMSLAKPFNPPAVEKTKVAEDSSVPARLRKLVETEKGQTKAMALANLAYLQQQDKEYDLALENYNLAIPLLEEFDDKYNLAVALNNAATVMMIRKEYDKALEFLLKCIDLRIELGAKEETVFAYNKLGYCYHRLGKLTESVESYRSALDLNMQLHNNAGLSDSYFNVGTSYEKMGDLKAAADMLQKSVECAKDIGDKARIFEALQYLGVVHFDSEDYSLTKKVYEQCRELALETGDRPGLAMSLHNLANAELRLNNLEVAKKLYEEALEIHDETARNLGVAASLHNLARAHHKTGNNSEAVSSALKGRNMAVKSSMANIEYMCSTLLERIKIKVGRDKYAELLSRAQEQMS